MTCVPISEVQGASSPPAPWHLSICSAKPPIPAGSWGPCCAILCVRASVSMGYTGTAFPPQAKYLQVVPWGQGCSCRAPAQGSSVFSLDHVLTPQLRSSPSVRSCLMAFFLFIAYSGMSKWSLVLAICFHISAHFPQTAWGTAWSFHVLHDSHISLVKDLEYLRRTVLGFFWLNKNLRCVESCAELQQICQKVNANHISQLCLC